MKNLILAVCITVAFSVPCMAEGIEPNGLFGLSGTVWEPQIEEEAPNAGFYEGKAYSVTSDGICVHNFPGSSYTDLLFFSVVHIEFDGMFVSDGIFSSLLGIGFLTGEESDPDTGETITVFAKKVSDDWYPEDCNMNFPE